jgi:phosphatidylserine/phosphatidylglycerophosphate/cardiolipin synthase-like enzyme
MNVTLEKVSKPLAPTCPDWQALCVPDLDCNGSLRLFTEGDNLHEAMISAIEAAQRSIRLEGFIFAADEIGWRFARALASKALAGWKYASTLTHVELRRGILRISFEK